MDLQKDVEKILETLQEYVMTENEVEEPNPELLDVNNMSFLDSDNWLISSMIKDESSIIDDVKANKDMVTSNIFDQEAPDLVSLINSAYTASEIEGHPSFTEILSKNYNDSSICLLESEECSFQYPSLNEYQFEQNTLTALGSSNLEDDIEELQATSLTKLDEMYKLANDTFEMSLSTRSNSFGPEDDFECQENIANNKQTKPGLNTATFKRKTPKLSLEKSFNESPNQINAGPYPNFLKSATNNLNETFSGTRNTLLGSINIEHANIDENKLNTTFNQKEFELELNTTYTEKPMNVEIDSEEFNGVKMCNSMQNSFVRICENDCSIEDLEAESLQIIEFDDVLNSTLLVKSTNDYIEHDLPPLSEMKLQFNNQTTTNLVQNVNCSSENYNVDSKIAAKKTNLVRNSTFVSDSPKKANNSPDSIGINATFNRKMGREFKKLQENAVNATYISDYESKQSENAVGSKISSLESDFVKFDGNTTYTHNLEQQLQELKYPGGEAVVNSTFTSEKPTKNFVNNPKIDEIVRKYDKSAVNGQYTRSSENVSSKIARSSENLLNSTQSYGKLSNIANVTQNYGVLTKKAVSNDENIDSENLIEALERTFTQKTSSKITQDIDSEELCHEIQRTFVKPTGIPLSSGSEDSLHKAPAHRKYATFKKSFLKTAKSNDNLDRTSPTLQILKQKPNKSNENLDRTYNFDPPSDFQEPIVPERKKRLPNRSQTFRKPTSDLLQYRVEITADQIPDVDSTGSEEVPVRPSRGTTNNIDSRTFRRPVNKLLKERKSEIGCAEVATSSPVSNKTVLVEVPFSPIVKTASQVRRVPEQVLKPQNPIEMPAPTNIPRLKPRSRIPVPPGRGGPTKFSGNAPAF